MKFNYLVLSLALQAILPTALHAADAAVSLQRNDVIRIHGNGDTTGNIIRAIAEIANIEIYGDIANEAVMIDYELREPLDDALRQLVHPQSVVLMYRVDEQGNRQVSVVELLPTGTETSEYLNDGAVRGYRNYSGMDPEKVRFHMERDLRRQERHARGLGRINQPNFGIVTKEEALEAKKQRKQQNQ